MAIVVSIPLLYIRSRLRWESYLTDIVDRMRWVQWGLALTALMMLILLWMMGPELTVWQRGRRASCTVLAAVVAFLVVQGLPALGYP